MLIYIHDVNKKIGYVYDETTRLYQALDKMAYNKLGKPDYYYEDISDKIDTRRDHLPLGDDVLCLSTGKAKVRDDSYYFTWSFPQPSLKWVNKPIPKFISMIRDHLTEENYTLEIGCDSNNAIALTEKLEQLSPLFHVPNFQLFKRPDISHKKFQDLRKFWVLLFLNYDDVTPRRPYIDKHNQLNSPMIIFNSGSKNHISRMDVIECLSLTTDELLKMLFHHLNVVPVQS